MEDCVKKKKNHAGKIPLVSVCMPVYKSAGTLGDAVRSVLEQQIPLELILVLDGKQDEPTERILDAFRNDPRLKVIQNENRMGAAASRNRAVDLARTKYVAFLDADDIWAQGKLRKQYCLMERTGMVLCCTGRELMTPDGVRTGRVIPVSPRITYRDLLRHNSINCSSVMVRTEAMRAFPMTHEDSHEDYIAWLQILRGFGPAAGINKPLLYYRLSSGGKSGSKLKSAKMTFRVYRYMGFSLPKSCACFLSYAVHGVAKYLGSWIYG